MQTVYLSRRNLLALLSKLDRNLVEPGDSQVTIIKYDTAHATYPCSDVIKVIGVEDAEYYNYREPGAVHPADLPLPSACTRPEPHVCTVNGPCNGYPKELPKRHNAGEACNCPGNDLWGCAYQ